MRVKMRCAYDTLTVKGTVALETFDILADIIKFNTLFISTFIVFVLCLITNINNIKL